jgi:hypothetical protein
MKKKCQISTIIITNFIIINLLIIWFTIIDKNDPVKDLEVGIINLNQCNEIGVNNNQIKIQHGADVLLLCGTLKSYTSIELNGYIYFEETESKPVLIYKDLGPFSNGSIKIMLNDLEKLKPGKYFVKFYYYRNMLNQIEFEIEK